MEDVAPAVIKTPDNDLNIENSIENLNIINDNNNNNQINNNNANNDNILPSFIKHMEYKFAYQNKDIIIKIALTSDNKYLYIQSNDEKNIVSFYELKISFEELIKFDKVFRICDNMEEAYNSMQGIFDTGKNSIEEINDNKLILNIIIVNIDGKIREKKLELLKKLKNKDIVIDILNKEIFELKSKNKDLENKFNLLKIENDKIKENFSNFKDEISQEINDLKEQIKNSKKEEEKEDSSIDSNIIKNKKDYNFILERLKKVNLNKEDSIQEQNSKISFTLLYRATRDGDSSSTFHKNCDEYRNTLVAVKTKKGLRFGGFTCESWKGNGFDKKDENAFCYSLDKMKIYNSIKGKNAIFASPDFGPAFENCIFEIKDNCFKFGGLCSDESDKYFDNHEQVYEINDGEEGFQVEEVEVFYVKFE